MNIIVISHRRSGTHLTIDSIINNFNTYYKKDYISLEKVLKEDESLYSLQQQLRSEDNIIKTHILPTFEHYTPDLEQQQLLNTLFTNSKKIYVVRNGMDVMVSLYHYVQSFDSTFKDMPFKDFLLTYNTFEHEAHDLQRLDFWTYHIESWQKSKFGVDLLFIRFEDWITNYEGTLATISNFIQDEVKNEITDIRLHNSRNLKIQRWIRRLQQKLGLGKKKYTAVQARKGTVNQSSTYFKSQERASISPQAKAKLHELGYETITV